MPTSTARSVRSSSQSIRSSANARPPGSPRTPQSGRLARRRGASGRGAARRGDQGRGRLGVVGVCARVDQVSPKRAYPATRPVLAPLYGQVTGVTRPNPSPRWTQWARFRHECLFRPSGFGFFRTWCGWSGAPRLANQGKGRVGTPAHATLHARTGYRGRSRSRRPLPVPHNTLHWRHVRNLWHLDSRPRLARTELGRGAVRKECSPSYVMYVLVV
jgi:hypothetical protein